MRSFSIFLLPFALIACMVGTVYGQIHILPPDSGMGIPAQEKGAYLIAWKPVEGAIAYEYVLSDNPLCFSGCAGDTRQRIVSDTFAVEYELQRPHWYFWITRAIFEENDTSSWTFISSFFATEPEPGPVAVVAPNPVRGDLRLRIDWGMIPNFRYLTLDLLNSGGARIFRDFRIDRKADMRRFQAHVIPLPELPPGYYVGNLYFGKEGDPVEKQTVKILLY
jgi:hypothetical protein